MQVRENNIEAIKIILNNIPNQQKQNYISAENYNGRTALGEAIKHQKNQASELILDDPQTDITIKNYRKETLLHIAAIVRDTTILAKLLQTNKIDINAKDEKGRTALHQAITNQNTPAIIELLADPRIDINAEDDKGRTTRYKAQKTNNQEIITLIEQDQRLNKETPPQPTQPTQIMATNLNPNTTQKTETNLPSGKKATLTYIKSNKHDYHDYATLTKLNTTYAGQPKSQQTEYPEVKITPKIGTQT